MDVSSTTINLAFPHAVTSVFAPSFTLGANFCRCNSHHYPAVWHLADAAPLAPFRNKCQCQRHYYHCRRHLRKREMSVRLPHVSVGTGLWASYDKLGPQGMRVRFAPGQRVSWSRVDGGDPEVPLTIDMVAKDHALWQNGSGAVLDRAIFPPLSSTPWWLRALFVILAVALLPWRNKLLNPMLWVQLQTIFFAHDLRLPWLRTRDMAMDCAAVWWCTACLGEALAHPKFLHHRKGGNDVVILDWNARPRNEVGVICQVYH
ncbi:uncharacterized protein Z519_05998 [Cladophialophora bantiana CBS 173.52]|uniref:Uncharacterized protein n=1 Tax=Cladophialophora bantiana (strain ATCC 10958 / CBS 173.52 / CDC B-1940 / NIH 8579) TaxID=1442370 RepID=A0A0D2HJB0_CLAB1|nr:uncharacterized protein Z519_05998 [Cladophialophora bantiana CBS 173.52]KIW93393.1 hypothetical protein Z519_05998 [Cladophialophora bantiana CBS 173.52]